MAQQMIGDTAQVTLTKDFFATEDGKLVHPGHNKARRLIGYKGQTVLKHMLEGTALFDDPNASYDDVPEAEASADDLEREAALLGDKPGGAKSASKATNAAAKKLEAEKLKLAEDLAAAEADKQKLTEEIAALKKAAEEKA